MNKKDNVCIYDLWKALIKEESVKNITFDELSDNCWIAMDVVDCNKCMFNVSNKIAKELQNNMISLETDKIGKIDEDDEYGI